MEANRKENCDFDVRYKEESWHIENVWIQENGEVAWFEAKTYRDGVCFNQIFSSWEVEIPAIKPFLIKV